MAETTRAWASSPGGAFLGAAALTLLGAAVACGSSNDAAVSRPEAHACASSNDCLHGETCVANACVSADAGSAGRGSGAGGAGGSSAGSGGAGGGISRSCRSTADCVGDETCVANVCVVAPSGSGGSTTFGSGGVGFGGTGVAGTSGGAVPGSGGSGTGGTFGGGAVPGSGGITGSGGVSPGNGGAGGRCAADTESCSVQTDCCGYPSSSVCTNLGSSLLTCTPLCSFNSDCVSGCCAPLAGVGSACAPASLCATSCAGDLAACSANTDCCGYPDLNRCVDFGLGTGPICAIVCTSGSECASGCCDPLSSGYSVCGPCQ